MTTAADHPDPSATPIDDLLEQLWQAGGTDLLILTGTPPLVRVDGALRPLAQPSFVPSDTDRLVSEVLGSRLMGQFREHKQVDFATTWRDKARVRGNAYRQQGSIALALRVIPIGVPELADLGLPSLVAAWAGLPRGLILVTGPTGSGKSTTLAAIVDHINTERAAHILTIEDPIEYVHPHKKSAISQREIGADTDSFADALRAALREDPDVVMVGEMRDPESIAAALTIAETGHLVVASLHTNDAAQTLDRIVDVFTANQQPQIRLQLAHVLVGVLNQQLVPRVTSGRVAAFEVLVATQAVRNLIREGKTRQIRGVISTGQRDGMQTLESNLNLLVRRGEISFEDAVAATPYPHEIVRTQPR